MKEYSVTERLPLHGERCFCFGHKTFCGKSDMQKEAQWHEVTFKINILEYKIKKEIPEDPEESILDYCSASESWYCGVELCDGIVIGVTKWKEINREEEIRVKSIEYRKKHGFWPGGISPYNENNLPEGYEE